MCTFCQRETNPSITNYNLRLSKDEEPSALEVIGYIQDPSRYAEVVFCGYGEPTLRLDEVKEIAKYIKSRGGSTRLNTNGHGSLIHSRDIIPELVGLIDKVSISLHAPGRKLYEQIVRSSWPVLAFDAVLEFARSSVRHGMKTAISVVRIPGLDVEACRKFADEIGAAFRIRELLPHKP